MSNGVVIHLDSDSAVLSASKDLFVQTVQDIDYEVYHDKVEFENAVALNIQNGMLKCLIFDLLGKSPGRNELTDGEALFLDEINDKFSTLNIPIFIYSGSIHLVEDKFIDCGTIFKVDKSKDFDEFVIKKFQLLLDSGFIDVFCPGGLLESEITKELNASFTKQFSKNNEIESVINSIMENSDGDQAEKRNRVRNVFKRIAIKSLSSELLAPVADNKDLVHPIEHFYKRQSKLPYWTGDIWKNKENGSHVVILTPRCDISKDSVPNIMFCNIKHLVGDFPKKPDKIIKFLSDHITDNLQDKSQRYIPRNVFLPEGGMVNLREHCTMSKELFSNTYQYVITLSDDFTNEIIGKFAYYFLRTGITTINEQEFKVMFDTLTKGNGKE